MTCPREPADDAQERRRCRSAALRLARLALALADRAGDLDMAARLQATVDAAEGRGPGRLGEPWAAIADGAAPGVRGREDGAR